MRGFHATGAAAAAALLVAACGGGGGTPDSLSTQNNSPARGDLVQNPPPRITAIDAAYFTSSLKASTSGQTLLALAGTPTCDVDVHYIQYATVGGAGEATQASGVLMTPSGTAAACKGPRPTLLYGHGTNTEKRYNLADFSDKTNPAAGEASMLAATYAAQGYIVVAPNYAGFDSSTLPYHPYLNANQSASDMVDALAAARKAMPRLLNPVSENGKLFVAGYSQGGHVAMATHRALQAAGVTVTASAPMSGPYAMSAFGDAIFGGRVNLGSTLFVPMIVTSYQRAYGNLYTSLSDVYDPAYAAHMDAFLPNALPYATLMAQGKLPQTALLNSTAPAAAFASITPPTGTGATDALFALGFGNPSLLNNALRAAYLSDAAANPDGALTTPATGALPAAPTHPFRVALKANDMRNWTPTRPMLLCGGSSDPTVFFSVNTQVMQAVWSAPSPAAMATGLLNVLDVDSAATSATDPYALVKGGFAKAKATLAAAAVAAGSTDGGASAVTQVYHSTVNPFCNAAARGFFNTIAAAGL